MTAPAARTPSSVAVPVIGWSMGGQVAAKAPYAFGMRPRRQAT
jgi:hypothetical protein